MNWFGFAPVHVLGLLASVVLFYRAYLALTSGRESVTELLTWLGFGSVVLVLSLGEVVRTRYLLDGINTGLGYLGFRDGTDGLFLIAILSLLFLVVHTNVKLMTTRRKLSNLQREVAIQEYQRNQGDPDE